jgi:hypothetical protein
LLRAPIELRSFEADAGTTNKINVRMETNALYTAERTTAARRITCWPGNYATWLAATSPPSDGSPNRWDPDGVIV